MNWKMWLAASLPILSPCAFAGGQQNGNVDDQVVLVQGKAQRSEAQSATQGQVTADQLENRPLARTAELLEVVPGVVVTQHSGDGKANQYFLRGFNLDHGTDLRTTVLGMPANMPTHAHGQGYTDLNFLIPELVATIAYRKGPYYAREGDFASAGSVNIDYLRVLEAPFASLELGEHRYRRALVAGSRGAHDGALLYAVEHTANDGPWRLPQDYRRTNAVLSYSWKQGRDSVRVTGMGMRSSWTAPDQIPRRAVEAGQLDPFGYIDPTSGGRTDRYSLSADWTRQQDDGWLRANAYLVRSSLDLYSNFTYFLSDPVNGDQFNQAERRQTGGLEVARLWHHALGAYPSQTELGLQLRHDRLAPVGLYATSARRRLDIVREDRVRELAAGLYASTTTRWSPHWRTVAGVRADHYDFDVRSANRDYSGKRSANLASPKFALVYSATPDSEWFLNWGRGFHSNDARGVVQNADAAGEPGGDARATPLVKTYGKELGTRWTGLVRGLQTSLSVWELDLASELVFVGDAGTTEASRPSRRHGIELANYYRLGPNWILDADLTWSRARFTDADPAGPHIPGAVKRTLSVGVSGASGPWSGGLRLRHVGKRPLIEDDSVRSPSSTLANARLAYALSRRLHLSLELLNAFDRRASDIDYYYESQLPGESEPRTDVHSHPAEPRTLRIGMQWQF